MSVSHGLPHLTSAEVLRYILHIVCSLSWEAHHVQLNPKSACSQARIESLIGVDFTVHVDAGVVGDAVVGVLVVLTGRAVGPLALAVVGPEGRGLGAGSLAVAAVGIGVGGMDVGVVVVNAVGCAELVTVRE